MGEQTDGRMDQRTDQHGRTDGQTDYMNGQNTSEKRSKHISKASPPTILLTEVKSNGKMTSPRLGTVDDLVANAALIPTVRPNGGVWVGGLGFGVKWVLETCLIVTNKGSSTGAQLDMGGVEFESDEAEEDAAVAAVAAEAW